MSVLSKAFGYRVRLESDDVDLAQSYELDLERARALGKARGEIWRSQTWLNCNLKVTRIDVDKITSPILPSVV